MPKFPTTHNCNGISVLSTYTAHKSLVEVCWPFALYKCTAQAKGAQGHTKHRTPLLAALQCTQSGTVECATFMLNVGNGIMDDV